ncbi:hypothetical protein PanWU01x14_031960 [Parasponia andersonii]|uniref:Endonuclease/exonuclease/phosphatase n=1 Tax=Parasponia andersonii TaxID=3476 RepID=A0A2P5DUC3_PARAD|nr:hypothetical protein PanWU01x14_031960 [Parasponia andersonii]
MQLITEVSGVKLSSPAPARVSNINMESIPFSVAKALLPVGVIDMTALTGDHLPIKENSRPWDQRSKKGRKEDDSKKGCMEDGKGKLLHVVSSSRRSSECFPKSSFLVLTGSRANNIKFTLGFSNGFAVDGIRRSGGLMLLWKEDWDVSIQSFFTGHNDAHIVSLDSLAWRFMGFYGSSRLENRWFSLELLWRLKTN